MGKKRTIWKKKLFDDASIRSMIFIYFTITALAASVLISLSAVPENVAAGHGSSTGGEPEPDRAGGALCGVIPPHDHEAVRLALYGTIKNADLSSQSLGSEFTLLYDNNKDNVENIALFSEDGALLEAVPAVRLKMRWM